MPAAIFMDKAVNDDAFIQAICKEIAKADERWSRLYHSAHEGYAVLLEEVDELWQHVKAKQETRDHDAIDPRVRPDCRCGDPSSAHPRS